MTTQNLLLGADDDAFVFAPARYMNRHGLITGGTGTGKSVSLMQIAEEFSRAGCAVFVTDVKGDLSGLAAAGKSEFAPVALERAPVWYPEANAVRLWDVYGEAGEPLTTTVRSMGATIMGRALALSDTQAGVLEIAFAVAEDHGRPLDTLNDLRDLLNYCLDNDDDIARRYGRITPTTVSTIGRSILRLERAGGTTFFGGQPFDPLTLIEQRGDRGLINILDGVRLIREPRLYGAFLLYLLSELFINLPEVGDQPVPKLAFFFDEAHQLFSGASADLVQEIDQTVRLIRSKGVGIFFVTQAPSDIPDCVLGQLHFRLQHTLRAVTAGQRTMVRNAADSMPLSDTINAHDHISSMPGGTAMVSFMGDDGRMTPVRVIKVAPPRCRLGELSDDERRALVPVAVETLAADPAIDALTPVSSPGVTIDTPYDTPRLGVMGKINTALMFVWVAATFPLVAMSAHAFLFTDSKTAGVIYALLALGTLKFAAGRAQAIEVKPPTD